MKAALEARLRGQDYRAIAEQMDVAVSTAYQLVQEAIADIPREAAKEVRLLEIARLDRLLGAVWNRAMSGVSPASVRNALRIMQRRAALLGLDAPRAAAVAVLVAQQLQGVLKALERGLESNVYDRVLEILAECDGLGVDLGPGPEDPPSGGSGAAPAGGEAPGGGTEGSPPQEP
ncbi:MAG TPA: hypothetical protein VGI39_04785 [Polyangiaceae bacterium]|jgi:hypothetical protein